MSSKKFFNKTSIILSILIFIIIFITLGIPYTNWWFNGDDFHGIFLGFRAQSLKDVFYFFYDGHTNQYIGPSNFNYNYTQKPDFMGAYYRPLYCVYLSIQYYLFGTNAYYYLLTNVFFHAINTVVLFNIFLYFLNYFSAFLVALFFAFHPQIGYRFGAIVNLHYYVNVMLILLTILSFKKYLDSKKIIFNILSCILFALSLLTRESSIVLPIIIFLGTYLYENKFNNLNFKNFFSKFFYNLKITSGLFITLISFLITRAILYPINLHAVSPASISIKKIIFSKFPQVQVFIYDLFGLSWLPWGHKTLRAIIIVSIFSLLTWLFIKNSKKIYFLYFLICTFLMLWPGIISYYSPRYFYEVAPFALIMFIFLFKFYSGKLIFFKNIFLIFLSFFICFLIFFDIHCFLRREKKMQILAQATQKLTQNLEIKNRALCFLAHPLDGFGDHPADIFWILFNNKNKETPIYCDNSAVLFQADSNIVKTTKWANIVSKYYSKNYFTITNIKTGTKNIFKFSSLNSNKIIFFPEYIESSLGQKIITKTEKINNTQVTTEFTLEIKEKYLKTNPVFIAWDYENKEFKILDSSSINKSKIS